MPSFLAPKGYTRQWVSFQGPGRALFLSDLLDTLTFPVISSSSQSQVQRL